MERVVLYYVDKKRGALETLPEAVPSADDKKKLAIHDKTEYKVDPGSDAMNSFSHISDFRCTKQTPS